MGRILTTHDGCLGRSEGLEETLGWYANGERVDMDALRKLVERSVAEVAAQQIKAEIDIINDGEVGFQHATPFQYMRVEALPPNIETLKQAIIGANVVDGFLSVDIETTRHRESRRQGKSVEEALFIAADVLRETYRTIIDAGFACQIDDAFIAGVYDIGPYRRQKLGSIPNYREWAEVRVEATNVSIRGLPPERLRYHTRWGSWEYARNNGIDLNDFIDLTLRIDVGAYALEMVNSRNVHEWSIWDEKRWPADRKLIPGVIDLAAETVDQPEVIAERICRIAQSVGRANIVAGTDSGFALASPARRAQFSAIGAKLASLSEGARLASKNLWP